MAAQTSFPSTVRSGVLKGSEGVNNFLGAQNVRMALDIRPFKWNTQDMGRPNIDISDLSTDERLALIEELWDSEPRSPAN
ncbi:MAG: hypothetical protein ACREDR_16415 [Blastocatellia bacterium]